MTKEGTPKQPASQPKEASEVHPAESKKDKWRTLPQDKQMKIYENTVSHPLKTFLAPSRRF